MPLGLLFLVLLVLAWSPDHAMLWRPSAKTSRSVPYGQATHSETGKNDEESSENDEAGLETSKNKAL